MTAIEEACHSNDRKTKTDTNHTRSVVLKSRVNLDLGLGLMVETKQGEMQGKSKVRNKGRDVKHH